MIQTALTDMFDLRHPVVLAPMGSVSGGLLAATVSNAGGLGLVGGGYGNPDWLCTELARARVNTRHAWGVGLITWAIRPGILDLALSFEPAAVMLSFGDPTPHAQKIKSAGCRLICQVQDVDQACLARDAGADIIVAQGAEAGGHGGGRSTLPLVPAVVDAVGRIPVVAAGGIGDGRGLAAALMLGAQGALVGTRFYACAEALAPDMAKQHIVASTGTDTVRTRAFDVVRGLDWPTHYTGRALRNRFIEKWDGRETELRTQLAREQKAYLDAVRDEDYRTAVIWAGEVADLIGGVEGAATLVARIGGEAEACLRRGQALVGNAGVPAHPGLEKVLT
ncbi:MAG TPA: nitronate monooxygenase [Burkholderiales bacterium]|nr:nitronate monooxygenase [Burkholderiales bacterium]